jgi:hypothetical protein
MHGTLERGIQRRIKLDDYKELKEYTGTSHASKYRNME